MLSSSEDAVVAYEECVQFCTQPELLVVLPFVEALEDNEVLMAENLLQVARIVDPHNRATFEPIQKPSLVSVCCMDPENYMRLPLSQFEEDNVLRELNKVLLAFRQQHQQLVPPVPATRRLSPIGESFSSTPTEHEANKRAGRIGGRKEGTERGLCRSSIEPKTLRIALAEEAATNTRRTPFIFFSWEDVHTQLKASPPPAPQRDLLRPPSPGRRGRFIVLGSSGECLPVNRTTLVGRGPPFLAHSESGSGSDEFHSAKSSLDNDEEDEGHARRYSAQLDTPERRSTFAARLRDALRRETNDSSTSSTDSSYAVGISVAGSGLADGDIKWYGQTAGVLVWTSQQWDDDVHHGIFAESESSDKFPVGIEFDRVFRIPQISFRFSILQHENLTHGSTGTDWSGSGRGADRDSRAHEQIGRPTSLIPLWCSLYELEELYDQYSRWLEDAEFPDSFRELDARDIAVVRFAGSLLKRTLSDSFAGISLTDLHGDLDKNKTKIALAARSLSLELARHKHKIAAQLVSMRSVAGSGVRPVATGNWGCGSTHVGEPQLKLVLQWLAASVAGVPTLHYFTCGHHKLLKLDTVCRVLLDRRWTVGELAGAALRFAQATLADPQSQTGTTLFDELIGAEKSAIN
uniref:PARG catalytic Macro domain-containing protein n=1 Tax=Timema douglasi TaxID=61478 RepID=A0A7R8ZD05_TIMDO|nr:unnamed protein product [Timema douglasi]